jgi:DNA-binding protein HU-beta
VIRLPRRDQQGSTHIPTGRSASSTDAFSRKVDRFLQRFAILLSKSKLGEPSMATPQVKTVRKTAPAARSNPATKTAAKPKATPAVQKLAATKASNKKRTATSAPKPASMTGPLPPIVTLKHLAEWAGYNHGIPKKQAIEMFTGFVADIGHVLKKGSKIRIPNLGVLQVRIRPARPARKGRNPATGEEIQIKASKASKKVAFRVAKGLSEVV